MEKKKVSQDFVRDTIKKYGINISTLAELMDMSATMVSGCFKHQKDAAGRRRNFPVQTLPRLNAALAALAEELSQMQLTFGSEETYTNNRGATYDPVMIQPIMNLHRYFKLTQFLNNVLGWTSNKKSIVLHTPSSKGYGCISEDDVRRINDAILQVSIVLSGIEVVAADSDSSI